MSLVVIVLSDSFMRKNPSQQPLHIGSLHCFVCLYPGTNYQQLWSCYDTKPFRTRVYACSSPSTWSHEDPTLRLDPPQRISFDRFEARKCPQSCANGKLFLLVPSLPPPSISETYILPSDHPLRVALATSQAASLMCKSETLPTAIAHCLLCTANDTAFCLHGQPISLYSSCNCL